MAEAGSVSPPPRELAPPPLRGIVERAEEQFVLLLQKVRQHRRWRKRFSRWVWNNGERSAGAAEGTSSYRFLLYTAVLREVEHQEEMDDMTVPAAETEESSEAAADEEVPFHPGSPTRPDFIDQSPGGSPRSALSGAEPFTLDVQPAPAMLPTSPKKQPSILAVEEGDDLTTNLTDLELRRILQDLMATDPDSGLPHPVLPVTTVACRLCRQAGAVLGKMPNVVSITVPDSGKLVIVGDIHGQFEDLLLILAREQNPSESIHYLFNGDWVDRGPCGCEVVFVLYCLMLMHPGQVFLNRGNHEDKNVSARYGFGEEVRTKGYPPEFWDAVQWSFEQVPLVYVIYKGPRRKLAVLHGGLPDVTDVTLEELDKIDRKRPIPSSRNIRRPRPRTEPPADRHDRIFQAVVWSDPRSMAIGERIKPSDRGAGFHFGAAVTRDFLKLNDFDQHLIRSHDVVHSGWMINHRRGGDCDEDVGDDSDVLCETVFSASNYHGPHSNQGAYVVITRGPKPDDADSPLALMHHQYYVRKGGDTLSPPGSVGKVDRCKASDDIAREEALPELERRAMSSIGSLIFQRRAQLLSDFQDHDPRRTGRVHKSDWANIMKVSVCQKLPWYSLCRYLCRFEPFGQVSYIPFLERFQNHLFRKYIVSWSTEIMPHVCLRLARCALAVQEKNALLSPTSASAARAQLPRISYQEVAQELLRAVPGLSATSAYYLFVINFDLDNDGFINRIDYDGVIAKWTQDARPGVLDLWGLRETTGNDPKSAYAQLISAVRGEGLDPASFVHRALIACGLDRRTDEAERAGWLRTAESISVDGKVTAEAVEAEIDKIRLHQMRAQSMQEIIESIARAKLQIQTVFRLLDVDQSNDLSFDEFREGLQRLRLGGDPPPDWEKTLFAEVDADQDGVVSIEEFMDALAVKDTWPQLEMTNAADRTLTDLVPGMLPPPACPPGRQGHGGASPSPPASPGSGVTPQHVVYAAAWTDQSVRGPVELRSVDSQQGASELSHAEAAGRGQLLDRESELRERHLLRLAVRINRECIRRRVPPVLVLARSPAPGGQYGAAA